MFDCSYTPAMWTLWSSRLLYNACVYVYLCGGCFACKLLILAFVITQFWYSASSLRRPLFGVGLSIWTYCALHTVLFLTTHRSYEKRRACCLMCVLQHDLMCSTCTHIMCCRTVVVLRAPWLVSRWPPQPIFLPTRIMYIMLRAVS